MGASTQVPPVLPLTPLLPQVVDGDGVIRVSRYYAFQDLQLVGLLDGFDACLCLFFADLQQGRTSVPDVETLREALHSLDCI